MTEIAAKSGEQKAAEAAVESFCRELGPFVVAAEKVAPQTGRPAAR